MRSARYTTIVHASPEAVFSFIADGENARSWRPAVLDVRHVEGSGLGARYAQGVRGPAGRRVDADYEVTAYEPPRRLAFRAVAGPVRPEGEYVLEPALGDATSVTFSLTVEMGGLTGLVLGRSVQRTMDEEVRTIERIEPAMVAAGTARPPD